MNMVTQILDSYPFQLLIAANLFACFFPKRPGFWPRVLVHALPMLVIYVIGVNTVPAIEDSMLSIGGYILYRLLLLIPMFYIILGIWFCYRCSFMDAVYCTASAYPAQNIVYNLYWIAKLRMGFVSGSLRALPVSLTLMTVVYTGVYFCFARRMRDWEERSFMRSKLVGNAFIVMLFVAFLSPRVTGVQSEQVEQMVYLSYMIGDVLALIMQFGLFTESGLERRNAIMEQLLYAEQKKQRMTAENVELINRKCHDLKHQIAALKRMGSGTERDAYIGKIEQAVMIYESAVKTGNETLDLILMDKQLYCEQHHIKLTCVADGAGLDYLDTMDLYSLFGNALDNAIESVSKEADEANRIISFRVGTRERFVVIHFENYVGEPVRLVGGLPVTSKEDREYHGFGVLSIRHIAEKYHGSMSIRTENNLFCLDIMIPLPERAPAV